MIMENLVEILKNDNSFIICFVLLIVLILGFIILLVKMQRLNKRYKTFMKKLSSNTNIEEETELNKNITIRNNPLMLSNV